MDGPQGHDARRDRPTHGGPVEIAKDQTMTTLGLFLVGWEMVLEKKRLVDLQDCLHPLSTKKVNLPTMISCKTNSTRNFDKSFSFAFGHPSHGSDNGSGQSNQYKRLKQLQEMKCGKWNSYTLCGFPQPSAYELRQNVWKKPHLVQELVECSNGAEFFYDRFNRSPERKCVGQSPCILSLLPMHCGVLRSPRIKISSTF